MGKILGMQESDGREADGPAPAPVPAKVFRIPLRIAAGKPSGILQAAPKGQKPTMAVDIVEVTIATNEELVRAMNLMFQGRLLCNPYALIGQMIDALADRLCLYEPQTSTTTSSAPVRPSAPPPLDPPEAG